jgi:hypothetical protein
MRPVALPRRRAIIDLVVPVLVVLTVVLSVTVVLIVGTWWWARSIAEKMRQQDRKLRPTEAGTGHCGACNGAGTRIESLVGRSASEQMVTCFRCGGTGEPPDEDWVPGLMPSPVGLHVRQLRDASRRVR